MQLLKEIKSNMQKLFDEYSAKYEGSDNINTQPGTSIVQNADATNQFADWRQFLRDLAILYFSYYTTKPSSSPACTIFLLTSLFIHVQ